MAGWKDIKLGDLCFCGHFAVEHDWQTQPYEEEISGEVDTWVESAACKHCRCPVFKDSSAATIIPPYHPGSTENLYKAGEIP